MFSSLSRKRVFVLLVLTSLLLITLDHRGNRVIDATRNGFQRALHPFDTAAEAISKPIARAWNGISNYDDLRKENEALRDQLDAQKGAEAVARSVIFKYQQLVDLDRLTSELKNKPVIAQVVGSAPSNFQNTVEITKGANDGIQRGMPVTNGAGLIGRIVKVYATSSVVRLITDPQFSVAAEVLTPNEPDPNEATTTVATTPSGKPVNDGSTTTPTLATATATTLQDLTPAGGVRPTTTTSTTIPVRGAAGSSTPSTSPGASTTTTAPPVRETGTVQGQGAGKAIQLRFVDDSSALRNVKVGASVNTAGGQNNLAPQGIPIGTVSKIIRQSGSQAAIIEVDPAASLGQLNFVSVVLYTPAAASG